MGSNVMIVFMCRHKQFLENNSVVSAVPADLLSFPFLVVFANEFEEFASFGRSGLHLLLVLLYSALFEKFGQVCRLGFDSLLLILKSFKHLHGLLRFYHDLSLECASDTVAI